MSRLSLFLLAAVASGQLLAAEPERNPTVANAPETETYEPGTRPDIAEVLSITQQAAHGCEAVPALITYLDHAGKRHQLRYSKVPDDCATR